MRAAFQPYMLGRSAQVPTPRLAARLVKFIGRETLQTRRLAAPAPAPGLLFRLCQATEFHRPVAIPALIIAIQRHNVTWSQQSVTSAAAPVVRRMEYVNDQHETAFSDHLSSMGEHSQPLRSLKLALGSKYLHHGQLRWEDRTVSRKSWLGPVVPSADSPVGNPTGRGGAGGGQRLVGSRAN